MTPNPTATGFHSITPHIVCQDAKAAIRFYKNAFGAELLLSLDMPNGNLLHAQIRIGDSIIMIMEENPECDALSPIARNGTSVTLHHFVADVDAAFKKAVDAGATVKMPPMDMFWGDRYSCVVDPFGHSWALATHIRDVSPEEMQSAAIEFCNQANMGCK